MKEKREHDDELEAIRAIARTRKSHDLEALCEEMQDIASRTTLSERAAIYLVDAATKSLVMAANPHGYDGELAARYRRMPLDGPIVGEVISKLKPLVFSASALPEAYRAPSIAAGFVEYAVIPLHSDGVLSGTLNLARTREEPYSPKMVELALTLGDQISVQIERARLYIAEKERSQSLAALNRDLTRSYEELARTQSELIRQERRASLGELAVLVAHEVRNPLGVIFNVATQLRKLPAVPSGAAELVGILEEEAARLERIVRAFLDFGRPVSPTFRKVGVRHVIETAIELTTRALSHSSVDWRIEVAPNAVSLEADEHLLVQALVSLLTNGAEAQSLTGEVFVRAASRGDGTQDRAVVIAVEDVGVAVDPEIVERVFDPFFTTKASGTGLGLAIVKRNIEAHAGAVTILPRKPKGTVVTLEIPVRAEVAKGASPS